MRILKRLAILALTPAMLTACSAHTGMPSPSAEPTEPPVRVGFVQVGAESDWRIANTRSMEETFTRENGYELETIDAQQKTNKQIAAMRSLILKEIDYIVLAPNTESGWDTVLQEAKDEGIPVIIVDRMIRTKDESLFIAWVGSDFRQEGRDAAEALAKVLEQKGVTGEDRVNIVTLQGTLGSTAQLGRTGGFAELMEEHPNWVMIDKRTGEFTEEKGREVMAEMLEAYGDIDVVIAENDNMAFGAVSAIKEAGRTCGPGGEITVISFDGVRAAFEAMIDGEIDAVVECNPLHGPRVRAIIEALEAGHDVAKMTYVEEEIFFASDAEALIDSRAY